MTLYGADGKPLRQSTESFTHDLADETDRMIEVTRSFAYKVNLGNYGGPQYESVDLFCSQKVHCRAIEQEDASLAAYGFCRREVLASRDQIITGLREKQAQRREAGRSAA